jgi:hypothetical protein
LVDIQGVADSNSAPPTSFSVYWLADKDTLILNPAAGTATFLGKVSDHIHAALTRTQTLMQAVDAVVVGTLCPAQGAETIFKTPKLKHLKPLSA